MKRNERGASIVEFAIVVPLFVLLVFGIIEAGWFFSQQVEIRNAVREGARIAVVDFGSANETIAETCSRADLSGSGATGDHCPQRQRYLRSRCRLGVGHDVQELPITYRIHHVLQSTDDVDRGDAYRAADREFVEWDRSLPLTGRSAGREAGAILPLTALLIVVLLLFAAFAVDLGSAWAERREAQTAADAGVMGAALQYLVSPPDEDTIFDLVNTYVNLNNTGTAFTFEDWDNCVDPDRPVGYAPLGDSGTWDSPLNGLSVDQIDCISVKQAGIEPAVLRVRLPFESMPTAFATRHRCGVNGHHSDRRSRDPNQRVNRHPPVLSSRQSLSGGVPRHTTEWSATSGRCSLRRANLRQFRDAEHLVVRRQRRGTRHPGVRLSEQAFVRSQGTLQPRTGG